MRSIDRTRSGLQDTDRLHLCPCISSSSYGQIHPYSLLIILWFHFLQWRIYGMDPFYPFLHSVHYPNKLVKESIFPHWFGWLPSASTTFPSVIGSVSISLLFHQAVYSWANTCFSYRHFIVNTLDRNIFLLVLVLGLTGNGNCYWGCIFSSSLLCLNYIDVMQNEQAFLLVVLLIIGTIISKLDNHL